MHDKFNSDSAAIKHNSGASREMVENGYEVLDSDGDNNVYGKTRAQNPRNQGWADAPIGLEPEVDPADY